MHRCSNTGHEWSHHPRYPQRGQCHVQSGQWRKRVAQRDGVLVARTGLSCNLTLGVQRSMPLPMPPHSATAPATHTISSSPPRQNRYNRISRANKNTASAFASLGWTLSRSAVIETGLQLNRQSGYLSDPYKRVLVGEATLSVTHARSARRTVLADALPAGSDERCRPLHLDARYTAAASAAAMTLHAAWHQTPEPGMASGTRAALLQPAARRFLCPVLSVNTSCRYCTATVVWAVSVHGR